MTLGLLTAVALGAWLAIAAGPWRPSRTRERLEPRPELVADGADTTVVIPARDEADHVAATVRAAAAQGAALRVIVVDDESGDGTAEAARAAAPGRVAVIAGAPLPAGWTGKLWALEQARTRARTPWLLLLDADIELRAGMLAALHRCRADGGYALVSVMAQLRMVGAWERLLMPAFVWFFKLLYPFRLANGPSPRIAAAAGGCVLLERRWLDAIGGFGAIRGAAIDDCALAGAIKAAGGRTWVGLTRGAVSRRAYPGPGAVSAMVTRTAFAQLHYSVTALLACTALMGLAFWVPPIALALGPGPARLAAGGALAAMLASYIPLLRYYRVSAPWALALPIAATLYLGMTWASAWRYARGTRLAWRGRRYGRTGAA